MYYVNILKVSVRFRLVSDIFYQLVGDTPRSHALLRSTQQLLAFSAQAISPPDPNAV